MGYHLQDRRTKHFDRSKMMGNPHLTPMQQLQKQLKDKQRELEMKQSEMEQQLSQMAALQDELKKLRQEGGKLATQTGELRKELGEANAENGRIEVELAKARANITALSRDRESLNELVKSTQRQIIDMEEKQGTVKRLQDRLHKKTVEHKELVTKLQRELVDAKETARRCGLSIDSRTSELQAHLDQAKARQQQIWALVLQSCTDLSQIAARPEFQEGQPGHKWWVATIQPHMDVVDRVVNAAKKAETPDQSVSKEAGAGA